MSSVKTTPSGGARPSTTSSPKMASSTTLPRASTVAATRSIASRARSGLLTLTSDISQLPGPRNWAMAGGSNGYRAGLVRRQLTPELISSLPGTAGLRPSISFWTGYPESERALCLVLLIGALDRVADVLPVLIAEVRELPEGSTSTAEEGASIDDDGFARQVIAAVGHQEGREIPQLLHPPLAAHRAVDRRGIVRLVHRGGADRAGVQALPCALRREETGGDGVEADAARCPLDGERTCHDVDAGLRHRGPDCEAAAVPH